jgi:hypothetical protein
MTVLGAFFGAILCGRLADKVQRMKIYGLEAAIMLCSRWRRQPHRPSPRDSR